MELKLKIAQVSQIRGGALVSEGPPRPGSEVFWRPLSNDGKRFYQLLTGTYKVLFSFEMEGSLEATQWRLDQPDLAAVGGLLVMTSGDPRQGGTLFVGDPIRIDEGVAVATLVEVPTHMCSCGDAAD